MPLQTELSKEEIVAEVRKVDVCTCRACGIEFVYYAVVLEGENKVLWPQVQTVFTFCPYCGEKGE